MADIVNDSALAEIRNSMRRSVERIRVRKGLLDWLEEVTDDICESYGIGGAGGAEKK